jgi:hypothetical protein
MTIVRTIFKNAFQANNVPDWTCPTCQKGILKSDHKNIKIYESAFSLKERKLVAWKAEWINGIFLGLLKCSNSSCFETVIITGKYKNNETYSNGTANDKNEIIINQLLTPTSFNPPIDIFHINNEVPRQIFNEIKNAFNVYWLDSSSCANKIRTVVELIMDDMKVAKTYIQAKKRKSYTLHKRIELFKIKKPEQADLLMAIKWIGNSGSHTGDNLTKDDILDSFEILEHVTNRLYETDSKRIAKLTKMINQRKRALGHNRRR